MIEGDRRCGLTVDIARPEIILIDDVLYTGRTIRAAIDNLVGRPAQSDLAVSSRPTSGDLPGFVNCWEKYPNTNESEGNHCRDGGARRSRLRVLIKQANCKLFAFTL